MSLVALCAQYARLAALKISTSQISISIRIKPHQADISAALNGVAPMPLDWAHPKSDSQSKR